MASNLIAYLVGRDGNGSEHGRVLYLPPYRDHASGLIDISFGVGPALEGGAKSPESWLSFSRTSFVVENGTTQVKKEPRWFEIQCQRLSCTWFLPYVRRMAKGEEVELEEIKAAYREHNGGKEIPCGKWGSVFTDGGK